MESIRCTRAMCRGISQWIDNLQLVNDRAGASVCDYQWQRILMVRPNVDEMNVQTIDLGDELRHGIEFRLDLAPVVLSRPIPRERLNRRELHALRCIRDSFSFRPLSRVYAPAQFRDLRLRNVNTEG